MGKQCANRNDGKYKSSLVQRLRDIIEFDVGKYMMSTTVQLNNGDIRESYTMKKKIQDWDPIERATVINGLDSQGRPKFIDKQWAFEKLLGLYNCDKTITDYFRYIYGNKLSNILEEAMNKRINLLKI